MNIKLQIECKWEFFLFFFFLLGEDDVELSSISLS